MNSVELAIYAASSLLVAWFTGYAWGFGKRFWRRIFIKSSS